MADRRIITLTTDFGQQDSYVAQMKAVLLSIEPNVRLVDLCHEVPPQGIAVGAYILETGYGAFPAGTIHLVVVDPGVGTSRRALAVESGGVFFVAPDNGVLTRVLEKPWRSHVLSAARYRRPMPSATFEGRDILAPAAAWIARGVDLAELGPSVSGLVRLPHTRARPRRGHASMVPVLLVDRFGNVTLDLSFQTLTEVLGREPDSAVELSLRTPAGQVSAFRRTYADGAGEGAFLLINSSGYLEVALEGARADLHLGLRAGIEVELTVG